MSLSVGVLITNYNSWPLAEACVRANLNLCGRKLSRLVLVDDCSTQPPPAMEDCVELTRNPTNIGFAQSLNKGLAMLDTDLIVIFDADARPLHDYVETVIEEFIHDPTLALLGFRTVDENNRPTSSFDKEPAASSLLLGQALYAKFKPWIERHESRIFITTCAMVIRKAALVDLVGFDEQLDWLDVDVDFSMKVNRSQWHLKVNPELVAYHKFGGTPILTADRVLKFYKNRWILLIKYQKIRNRALAKRIILWRLRCEYLFLQAVGRLMFNNNAISWLDKVDGRKKIIQYCCRNY